MMVRYCSWAIFESALEAPEDLRNMRDQMEQYLTVCKRLWEIPVLT